MVQAINSGENSFSWKRVAMVGRFYYPTLRNQIILYVTISAAVALAVSVMPINQFYQFIYSIMSLACTLMLWWGSGLFARSSRECDVSLPALWSEKAVFILFYTLIAVPLMVWLPGTLVRFVAELVNPTGVGLFVISGGNVFIAGNPLGLSSLQALIPITTCLYVVFRSAKSTFTRAAVWSVLSMVFLGIVMVCVVMWRAVSLGLEHLNGANGDEVIRLLGLDFMQVVAYTVSVLYAALMIWLTVRAIRNMEL